MYDEVKSMIEVAINDINAGNPQVSIARSLIAIATLLNESRDVDGSFSVATFGANI